MERFYRIQEAGRDVAELLDPANWRSQVWTGRPEKPCPAGCNRGLVACPCDGDPDCFSCDYGSLRCPTCDGEGWVEDTVREGGVSCCRTYESLLRYFAARQANLDGTVLVEVEGDKADEEDFDADEGAVLVEVRRIVSVRPFNPAELEEVA